MAWNVKGTYIETCSCDFFCPCYFNMANVSYVTVPVRWEKATSTEPTSAGSPLPRSWTVPRS